ncbi:MAG: 50S ribosomal protein L21 [Patescibacteria group bacterium]|nr:50S ribosomal protein L21 [Patescibacteria group bacterium]MDD4304635.1 50S ribosomal protein L21 [Patescibacteria group bacterium]MDD4695562.1 50S ribosomal protein L21 [Patescibacteria group bacterium]
MKLAVIKTGAKQYKVKEGDKIKVEKIIGAEGEKFEFDNILLIADGDKVELGKPNLDTKVEAKVLKQVRARKVRVEKYKNKTRYHKVYGHRQHFTELEITKI